MQKTKILTYFIATLVATMLLTLTLFHIASVTEETKRAKVAALARSLGAEGMDLPQLQTSLKGFLGDEVLLTVKNRSELKIHWQSRFAATDDSIAWTVIFGLPFLMLICLVLIPTILYKKIVLPQSVIISQLNGSKKSHQSMQMFAHDIRKPFSALKALLEILNKGSVTNSMESVVKRLLPEVDSLLGHVDGMITDLIQEGNPANTDALNQISALDKILDAAVSESAKKHANSVLPITWNLQHSLKPNAAEKALVRCFSNLICNAIEAIGPEERLWIKSRDSKINGGPAIEVIIGNSGKPIPKDVLAKLFTPFFTSGKTNGTGLGLAYVKKTLEELNGYAAARSEASRGTEFILTIPALPVLDKVTRDLPSTVNQVQVKTAASNEKQIAPINILVVEDQDIYFESLKAAGIERSDATRHSVHHARDYRQAANLIEKLAFDLVICDIDLGDSDTSGIDVIKALKAKGTEAKIYVYSNKNLDSDELRFVELATDGNLRKPANTQDLRKVLANAAKGTSSLPVVAIIDDDCFVRELWSMQSNVIDTQLFASPEDFLAEMNSDPNFIEQFDAFIVDYYFAEGSRYTGDQVAKEIRALTQKPIIISSDIQSLPEASRSVVTGQISKDCQSWKDVQDLIARCA